MSAVSNDFPPLTTENVESFIKNMMNALVLSTKTSNSIPSGSDFEYFSNFGEFRLGMGELSSTVADHIQQICQAVQHSSDDVSAPPEDLSDAALYDLVVDMIDSLLESADSMMEKSLGGGDNLSSSVRDTLISDQGRIFSETKDMPKPQLKFLEDIDNSRRRPFRPHVPDKPHAVVPLDMNEQPVERDSEEDLSVIGPSTYFPHPYTREIQGVPSRAQYQSQIADAGFVGPELPSAGQPFELVETLEALERMAEELDGVKEVGVDLEHHHHRTYQGLTCLMQVIKVFILHAIIPCRFGVLAGLYYDDLVCDFEMIHSFLSLFSCHVVTRTTLLTFLPSANTCTSFCLSSQIQMW